MLLVRLKTSFLVKLGISLNTILSRIAGEERRKMIIEHAFEEKKCISAEIALLEKAILQQ